MSKSIVFLFLLFSQFAYGMTQEAANERLLQAAKKLDVKNIIFYLCQGADKHYIDIGGNSIIDTIVRATKYYDDKDNSEARKSCLKALKDNPEKIIEGKNLIIYWPNYNVYRPIYNTVFPLGTIDGANYHYDTLIHRAIRAGNDAIVRKIINGFRGVIFNDSVKGINYQNDNGDTPLHLVMKTERSVESKRRLILLLVSHGADASILNNDGKSPMTLDLMFWIRLISRSPRKKENILIRMFNGLFLK